MVFLGATQKVLDWHFSLLILILHNYNMRLCNHKSGELSWNSDYGTGWAKQELWFDSEQTGDILPSSKAFRADVGLTQPPVQ